MNGSPLPGAYIAPPAPPPTPQWTQVQNQPSSQALNGMASSFSPYLNQQGNLVGNGIGTQQFGQGTPQGQNFISPYMPSSSQSPTSNTPLVNSSNVQHFGVISQARMTPMQHGMPQNNQTQNHPNVPFAGTNWTQQAVQYPMQSPLVSRAPVPQVTGSPFINTIQGQQFGQGQYLSQDQCFNPPQQQFVQGQFVNHGQSFNYGQNFAGQNFAGQDFAGQNFSGRNSNQVQSPNYGQTFNQAQSLNHGQNFNHGQHLNQAYLPNHEHKSQHHHVTNQHKKNDHMTNEHVINQGQHSNQTKKSNSVQQFNQGQQFSHAQSYEPTSSDTLTAPTFPQSQHVYNPSMEMTQDQQPSAVQSPNQSQPLENRQSNGGIHDQGNVLLFSKPQLADNTQQVYEAQQAYEPQQEEFQLFDESKLFDEDTEMYDGALQQEEAQLSQSKFSDGNEIFVEEKMQERVQLYDEHQMSEKIDGALLDDCFRFNAYDLTPDPCDDEFDFGLYFSQLSELRDETQSDDSHDTFFGEDEFAVTGFIETGVLDESLPQVEKTNYHGAEESNGVDKFDASSLFEDSGLGDESEQGGGSQAYDGAEQEEHVREINQAEELELRLVEERKQDEEHQKARQLQDEEERKQIMLLLQAAPENLRKNPLFHQITKAAQSYPPQQLDPAQQFGQAPQFDEAQLFDQVPQFDQSEQFNQVQKSPDTASADSESRPDYVEILPSMDPTGLAGAIGLTLEEFQVKVYRLRQAEMDRMHQAEIAVMDVEPSGPNFKSKTKNAIIRSPQVAVNEGTDFGVQSHANGFGEVNIGSRVATPETATPELAKGYETQGYSYGFEPADTNGFGHVNYGGQIRNPMIGNREASTDSQGEYAIQDFGDELGEVSTKKRGRKPTKKAPKKSSKRQTPLSPEEFAQSPFPYGGPTHAPVQGFAQTPFPYENMTQGGPVQGFSQASYGGMAQTAVEGFAQASFEYGGMPRGPMNQGQMTQGPINQRSTTQGQILRYAQTPFTHGGMPQHAPQRKKYVSHSHEKS
jgi:hypothetical protein